MKTPEEIAQWVIDNRFPKSEKEKITDSELYHALVDEINKHADQFKNPPKKTIEERRLEFTEKVYNTASMYQVCSDMPMIIDFINYWTEHSEGAKKMRFEKEKVFDIKKRLERWKRNQKPNYGKSEPVDRDKQLAEYLTRTR